MYNIYIKNDHKVSRADVFILIVLVANSLKPHTVQNGY